MNDHYTTVVTIFNIGYQWLFRLYSLQLQYNNFSSHWGFRNSLHNVIFDYVSVTH